MRILDVIKYLRDVAEDYGNLPITINGLHDLNEIVLYDEKGAPDYADDFNGYPVEMSMEE